MIQNGILPPFQLIGHVCVCVCMFGFYATITPFMLIIIAYMIKRALIKREVHLFHYSCSVQLPWYLLFVLIICVLHWLCVCDYKNCTQGLYEYFLF